MGSFSLIRNAGSDLSDSEREDREVTALMPSGRKPPRKRKHERGEGAPREQQRVKRVIEKDTDMKTGVNADKDLSLNYKYSADGEEITSVSETPVGPEPVESPSPASGEADSKEMKPEELIDVIGILDDILDELKDINAQSADGFVASLKNDSVLTTLIGAFNSSKSSDAKTSAKEKVEAHLRTYVRSYKSAKKDIKKVKYTPDTKSNEALTNSFSKFIQGCLAPCIKKGEKPAVLWVRRAALWEHLSSSINNSSLKDVFDSIDMATGEAKPSDLAEFVTKNPEKIEIDKLNIGNELAMIISVATAKKMKKCISERDWGKIVDGLEKDMKEYGVQLMKSLAVAMALKNVAEAMKYMKEKQEAEPREEEEEFLELTEEDQQEINLNTQHRIDHYDKLSKFLTKDKIVVPEFKDLPDDKGMIKAFKDGLARPPYEIPENSELYPPEWRSGSSREAGESRRASSLISYRPRGILMKKTAGYHGIVEQGHPSGPTNTPWKSIDKRYLGKEHFASIIKCAKDILNEQWFKSGWDIGAVDAAHRAALDLAIHTADDSAYQSKIDAPTYNMLLNKLASGGYDDMVDTMLPGKISKQAGEFSTHDRENVEFKSLSPEEKSILDEAAAILEAHGRSEEFDSLVGAIEFLNMKQPPVGAIDELMNPKFSSELESVKEVLYKTANVLEEYHPHYANSIRDLVKWGGARVDRNGKSISRLSDKFNETHSNSAVSGTGATKMAEHKASVEVDLNTLVRVAFENPGARAALLPIIAAKKPVANKAKKPSSGAASEAESEKKPVKKGKKPAKKPAKKGKKHTASVTLDSSDYSW